jgi:hypothetical protein
MNLVSFPHALQSPYQTPAVNDAILLYEGEAIVSETARPNSRQVKIVHEWTPTPVVICEYATWGEQSIFFGSASEIWKPVQLEIPELAVKADMIHHQMWSRGNSRQYRFRLNTPVVIGRSEKLTRVVFHLVNCRSLPGGTYVRFGNGSGTTGRIVFSFRDWTITIDRSDIDSKLTEVSQRGGGYAITHRVQFARTDGHEFQWRDVLEGVELVEQFIVLLTGTTSRFTLPIGYLQDDPVWKMWMAQPAPNGLGRENWSSQLPERFVQQVFNGFAVQFSDPNWKEPLRQSIEWYALCQTGSAETSIVLSQAALELLSSVAHVENDVNGMSESKFENLKASDRIRELLTKLRMGFAIPPLLHDLRVHEYDGKNKYSDGPHAFTDIRNGITHPKKIKRDRLQQRGPHLRWEASLLGAFYLECSILGLCGYFGPIAADMVCGGMYAPR